MNFVSLFAGVGGFDLAFERAGMDCVGQVEIDKNCREVLSEHWPEVSKWEDIHDVTADRLLASTGTEGEGVGDSDRTGSDLGRPSDNASGVLDGGNIERRIGPVDVLVGGFPCQDYSVAGRRGGLAGDRGALWWQFHRLIAECRPRWVVGENVPGLLSSNGGRDFGTIVGSLVELGYGVCWRVLDAQYFGVAQRRRRVLIVGHSGGHPRPEILFEPESLSGDPPPRRETGKEVAGTLGRVSENGSGRTTDLDGHAGDIAPTLRSMNYAGSHVNGGGQVAVAFNPYRTATGPGEYVEGFKPDPIHDALTANPAPKGPPLVIQDVRGMSKDQNGVGVSDGGVAYTLDQTGAQGVVAFSVRRLTPLECERLQGFPDNWTASQSDTQRYRQMGNAVAVPVAEWVGNRIAKGT